jgi:integrase
MMKREKLPRGIRRRENALVVTFALADGTIKRRSLGMVSVGYAIEQRGIFKRQVREGTYEKRAPRAKETVFTVGDHLWPAYLLDYRNRGGKDAGRLEIAWNHLKPKFEKMRVEEVTTNSISEYIAMRRAAGVQNGTINRETAALRAAFNHGTRVTPPMVERIPAFPVRLPEAPPRKGFIGDKQYAVLAANAKEPWLRALVACAYNFGFRKGELLNLRVGQVDLLEKWIELREGETKNGEARKVH